MDELLFLKEKSIKIYFTITIFFLITFCLLISFFRYDEYLNYYGTMNNDFLTILVEKENISYISNQLWINDKKKICEINKVSRDYIVGTNYQLYHEVYYKCNISENDFINGYVFNIKIKKGNTTLLNKIKNIL